LKIIILKNQTASDIELITIGETIPASDEIDVSNLPSVDLRSDMTLITAIQSGDVVVNDGTMDFDVIDSEEYIRHDVSSDQDGFWLSKRRRFTILWNQIAHGFVQGEVIRLDDASGSAIRAMADSHSNSATTSIVQEIIDNDSFYAGVFGSTVKDIDSSAVEGGLPLIVGKSYFLSPTTAGQMTASVPIGAGEIVKLIGVATNVNAIAYYSMTGYENETALESTQVVKAQDGGSYIRTPNTWVRAVNEFQINDPSTLTPINGDRIIVGAAPIGLWVGQANNLAEYVASTASWFFTNSTDGFISYVKNDNTIVSFDGSTWNVGAANNTFDTFVGDSGTKTATSVGESFSIVGDGDKMSTSISGNVLTISWGNANLSALSDVSNTVPIDGQVLTFDSVNGWQPETITNVFGDLSSVTISNSSNVAIPLSFTNLTWDTTHVENNTAIIEHDNVNTHRILIKETGLYLIAFSLSFDADAGEETISARLVIDDTNVVPGSLRVTSEDDEINDLSNTFTAELTAGTYITIQHQASGNGNVLHNSSSFSVTRASGIKGDPGSPGLPGSGTTINVEQDNVAVVNTPHDIINFQNMTASDAGGGQVDVQNIFGSEFQISQSLGVTTTTSTTFQNKVTLTTTLLPAGTYRLGVSYGWNHDSQQNDFEARIREGGIDIGEIHKQEPKDSAGSFSTTGSSQRYYVQRTLYRTLTSGVQTYTLDFRTDSGGDESSMWDAVIELWRVT